MIKRSADCIVYYDENYAPPNRKNNHSDLTNQKIQKDYRTKKYNLQKIDFVTKKLTMSTLLPCFFLL